MNRTQIRSFIIFTVILSISIFSLFDGNDSLKQLQKHFHNCEYEKTINLAENILGNPNLDKKEKLQIYIMKGISEFSSNKFLNAEITFTELILFDQNINLDSNEVSPKIIKLFNDLKKRLTVNNT